MEPAVAVVGMGHWGKNLVRNFHELGALSVVCDSDPATEDVCREKYVDAGFCTNFNDVLEDPGLTAVVIATPAVRHFDMVKSALEAGKDVFVEKPLAMNVEQGAELVRLAEEGRRILMVGHILRYHPAVKKLQDLVRGGDLGQIRYLYSNRLNIGKIRTEENILWSFAPHDISVILSLLDEFPSRVSSQGGAHLSPTVCDVTLSQFEFSRGVQAHIFVSWLHPFKEQRLVVVGSEKMAVFDDTAEHKLVLYPHRVEWKNRVPMAVKAQGEPVEIEPKEPLNEECRHFLDCVAARKEPVTDGREGLRVLRVLDACQQSLSRGGSGIESGTADAPGGPSGYQVHKSAFLDDGADVGAGTRIWHFSHVMKGAKIGAQCIIGQNVNIDGGTVIGDNVKIQNNVSVYTGTIVEDDVFLGPSCVLTNVTNPRSQISRHSLYEKTIVRRGSTIGANATVVCGVTVGKYAFVGAGAVVTRDVCDYGLVVGNPARFVGWMSRHGHRLGSPDAGGIMRCPESGYRYRETEPGVLRCLDLDEDAPLPEVEQRGTRPYGDFKESSLSP